VLDQVTALMAANNVNKIFITGHSLGAAIGTLQAAFLKEQLGDTVDIKVRAYGLPRVGNLDWAYVFSHPVEIEEN
jgi:predicted lipase